MNGWLEKWRHQPEPWQFGWVGQRTGPMHRGDKVRILRRSGDGMSLAVEHPEHGEQFIAALVVELPREFRTARGHWIPESDPRSRRFLLKAIEDLRAGGKKVQSSADPGLRQRTEAELVWILRRNGWDAPAPQSGQSSPP